VPWIWRRRGTSGKQERLGIEILLANVCGYAHTLGRGGLTPFLFLRNTTRCDRSDAGSAPSVHSLHESGPCWGYAELTRLDLGTKDSKVHNCRHTHMPRYAAYDLGTPSAEYCVSEVFSPQG
jgi:hypothetical protein